jgi:hypothetical protein
MTWINSRNVSIAVFILSFAYCGTAKPTCGSLVTYNQYSDLLNTAPQCFRSGCQPDPLKSMSTSCASTSPCFPFWNITNQEHQKENQWCDKCGKDRACRIPQWPVLNATSVCNSSPGVWIFGPNGECCSSGSQPRDLVNWVIQLCDDKWRDQFAYFDGMARVDWEQWEMPYNWTVRAVNTTERIVLQPTCPRPSKYFGSFVAQHLVYILAIALNTLRGLYVLKRKHDKEQSNPNHGQHGGSPIDRIKRFFSRLMERFSRDNHDRPPNPYIPLARTIIFALFATATQVAGNFGSAALIGLSPGYQETPIGYLGLLFCARPRLFWLSCLFWLVFHFHLENDMNFPQDSDYYPIARKKLEKLVIGFALAEIIMQFMGAYSLGKAADVGRQRKFYNVGRLWPFWRGRYARILYVGALFWLIAALVIVIIWGLLLWFAATFWAAQHFVVQLAKRGVKKVRERFGRQNNEVSPPAHGTNESTAAFATNTMAHDVSAPEHGTNEPTSAIVTSPLAHEISAPVHGTNETTAVVNTSDLAHETSHPVRDNNEATAAFHTSALVPARAVPVTTSAPPASSRYQESRYQESRYQVLKERPKTWDRFKIWLMVLAIVLGIVSFIAQWLFWAGLVKTWGEER